MNSLTQLIALTNRILKQNFKSLDTIVTVIAMPVFMLLFFVYIFGGNITLTNTSSGTAAYLNYSLPGFLLLTMATGSAYTALRINTDKTKGFLSRLHSLPIKRWIILSSHVLASVIFMLLAELAVLLVGVLMGYRIQSSLGAFIIFMILSMVFAVAITLVTIPFSLKAKNYASAGGFSYVLLMLLFVSSALMPTKGMAKPVQVFADNQPITPIVNTARELLTNGININQTAITTIIWLSGSVVLFSILSYMTYKKVYLSR